MVRDQGMLNFILRLLTYGVFLMTISCHGPSTANILVPAGSKDVQSVNSSDIINFRTFRNSDNTWGFTVFVNSMPFRYYNRIPYKNSPAGFVSREEAENVANLFVRMIQNGDLSPRLDRESADSLKITVSKRKMPAS